MAAVPFDQGIGQLAIADGAAQIARGERSYGLMITSSSDGWKHVTRRSHAMALGDACVKEKGSQREKWMARFNQWREQNNEAKGKNQPVPQSLFAQLAEI